MANRLISFILLTYLFSLPTLNDARQADELGRFIKSKRPSKPLHDDSWLDLDAKKQLSPAFIASQEGLMQADKITELPGQPTGVDFDQYGGYVTVDPRTGRALFYYFVESSVDPSSKPLVLWLNGGPGCSSLGYGAMEELGPFRVNSDGKTLYRNMYAWNNVANVLFLESPAGVGFSYSNTTADYDLSGDRRTADDSYTFLINWLERFPQYKNRDLFITGESYAGHYGPQLAYTILQQNKVTNQTVINLRGVAIGNAYVDKVLNDIAVIDFLWSHALFSDETYAQIRSRCNFSSPSLSEGCIDVLNKANDEVGDVDPYNIYAPICHASNGSSSRLSSYSSAAEFDPCTNSYTLAYLNNPEVQRALHANLTSWGFCRHLPWTDGPQTVHPVIEKVIASGINVWLYSGDVDAVVPVAATRLSIRILGLPVEQSWRPWYSNNSQVGGYVEKYKGLTLVTVRGAGHEVPSYQPERALTMISAFLQGNVPPPPHLH